MYKQKFYQKCSAAAEKRFVTRYCAALVQSFSTYVGIDSTNVLVGTLNPLYWALWLHWQRALSLQTTIKIVSPIASSHGQLFRPFYSRPHQHGIASKQAQVPKTKIINGKSAMFVGCSYKDELKYKHKKMCQQLT